ncbi:MULTISPECIES: polysaccharide deacetylase [unclassified Streptomyces]|uniref:polysaccharide deacetylase family protein n=1 Tax=unclassified Streptomyces TaxID=2593676 RepID=UPI0036E4A540
MAATDSESALEPWQWPEAVWRPIVEQVRAGRPLARGGWPDGARVAVAISFDSDHETPYLRDNAQTPGTLAAGEYGARVAVPRLLRLLAEYEVPATFFMPAVSALLHPDEVDAYMAAGHELGVHGWIHERNTLLSHDNELELTARSLDTLERLSGRRPVGIRTPSWDFSPSTLHVLRELGFRYDSSLMADDGPYELLADGSPTGLVEIPVEWIRDDAPYFAMARYAGLRPYTPPAGVLDIWKREFDGAVEEGGLFQLTMHPSVIGHRSRFSILRELLAHIRGTSGVWWATHEQVAAIAAADLGTTKGDIR